MLYYTTLKRFDREKHPSLLDPFINYEVNKDLVLEPLSTDLRFTGGVLGSVLSDPAIPKTSLGQKDDVAVLEELEHLAAVFG